MGQPRLPRTQGQIAADRDDAAVLAQACAGGSAGHERRAQIDRDRLVEIGDAEFRHRSGDEDAGIVHENIELAKLRDCRLDRPFHRRRIAVVGGEGTRPPPRRLDGGNHLMRPDRAACIGQGHVGTVRRQPARDRRADAPAAPGHEGHPSRKSRHPMYPYYVSIDTYF